MNTFENLLIFEHVNHLTTMRLKSLIIICLLYFLSIAQGQDNVGLRLFGLSIHPHSEAENAAIMPLRLDPQAYLVQNLGAILSYERAIYRDVFSTKLALALYSDCAARLGGFVHIGLRGRIFRAGRHSMYGGLGPTLIFRRNWLELADYKDQKLFKGSKQDRFQHLFLWYGGEFDYRYQINQRLDGVISLIPGYPDLISLSVGINYKL
ncbi:MAG: hypothetical protein Q4A64_02130 [Porphyromonadaceae bacterium]|nr:hypothetical protein [Porphyromonadaceae bacterium]